MGLMSNIKNIRKSLAIVNSLKGKNDDELNNLLYDLRINYKILDDDWMRIEASVSLLTQRRMLDQLGMKNNEFNPNLEGDSNVEHI